MSFPRSELQPFSLVPFPGDSYPAGLQLLGSVSRRPLRAREDERAAILHLRYRLVGPWPQLQIPAATPQPERRDGLWQATCLECFLARPGEPAYWELNLCPSGHWNAYRLPSYRGVLLPESGFSVPQMQREVAEDWWEVRVQWELPPALAAAPALEVGVTAVIGTQAGAISYWALCHPGPEADFHRRDSFCLQL